MTSPVSVRSAPGLSFARESAVWKSRSLASLPGAPGRPSRSRSRPPPAASGPARATGPAPRRRPPPPRPRRRPPAADAGRRTRSARPAAAGRGRPWWPACPSRAGPWSGTFATSSRARIASAAGLLQPAVLGLPRRRSPPGASRPRARAAAPGSESTRRWASLTRSAGPAAAGFRPKMRYSAPAMSPSERTTMPGIQWLSRHRRSSARTASRYGSSDVGRSFVGSGRGRRRTGRRIVRAMANPPPTSSARGSIHTRTFIPLAGGSSSAHSP